MSELEDYPEKYLEGIRLFNEEEFFECHDVLEELWTETRGDERLFYQGLIQASVALFHFGNENLGGARKLYHSSTEKLKQYLPHFMSLNLDRFLGEFQYCFEELLSATDTYPTGVMLLDERVPKWHLVEGEPLDN